MGSLEALILEILYKTEVNQWSDGTFEDGFIAAAELEVWAAWTVKKLHYYIHVEIILAIALYDLPKHIIQSL